MVRLYKKLFEYDLYMRVEPDVSGDIMLFTFETTKQVSEYCPIPLSMIELYPDEAEDVLLKHLSAFLHTIR